MPERPTQFNAPRVAYAAVFDCKVREAGEVLDAGKRSELSAASQLQVLHPRKRVECTHVLQPVTFHSQQQQAGLAKESLELFVSKASCNSPKVAATVVQSDRASRQTPLNAVQLLDEACHIQPARIRIDVEACVTRNNFHQERWKAALEQCLCPLDNQLFHALLNVIAEQHVHFCVSQLFACVALTVIPFFEFLGAGVADPVLTSGVHCV